MKKIKNFDFKLSFSKKINQKTLRITILKKGEVKVSMPYFYSEKKALLFVNEHKEWILTELAKQKSKVFQNNDEVFILGKIYKIIHDEKQKGGILVKDGVLFVGGEKEFLHRRICNFAKKELLKYIYEKSSSYAALIDKKINKITLKDVSSRWGSCSSKGNLNFCFKLAFAPIFVIDYLIAHEVAHLKEMNHSAAFWQTVALMETEQAKASNWLRKNGADLMKIK
ncbi:MAG: M48 family metallopeptidase [Alphaproteobacteria bacterium]|nr:M48 family metallopeptidase [Alphaproteobacteria bacterium]